MRTQKVSPVNLDVRNRADERAIVRRGFSERGESVVTWAIARGFNPAMVHAVLSGKMRCQRGQAHEIAVALGLKPQNSNSIGG